MLNFNGREGTYRPVDDIVDGSELGFCICCRQRFPLSRGYYVLKNNQITCYYLSCRIKGAIRVSPVIITGENEKKKISAYLRDNKKSTVLKAIKAVRKASFN
jgi:hypothetical protein